MKFARIWTTGLVITPPANHQRRGLMLQRAVDNKGDSIMVTTESGEHKAVGYIVPTEEIKALMEKELKER